MLNVVLLLLRLVDQYKHSFYNKFSIVINEKTHHLNYDEIAENIYITFFNVDRENMPYSDIKRFVLSDSSEKTRFFRQYFDIISKKDHQPVHAYHFYGINEGKYDLNIELRYISRIVKVEGLFDGKWNKRVVENVSNIFYSILIENGDRKKSVAETGGFFQLTRGRLSQSEINAKQYRDFFISAVPNFIKIGDTADAMNTASREEAPYMLNFSWISKDLQIIHESTWMHERIENILSIFYFERSSSYKDDHFTRWVQDGLADYFAELYCRKKYKQYHDEDDLIFKSRQTASKKVDILEWYFPTTYEKSECDYLEQTDYYIRAVQFFNALEEQYGYEIIEDLLGFIYQAERLMSEDVLLFLENRIGKENLSDLIGENYIKRVKTYRMNFYRQVFEENKNNLNLLRMISAEHYISAPDELKAEIREYLSGR